MRTTLTSLVTVAIIFCCHGQTPALGKYIQFDGLDIASGGDFVEVPDHSTLNFDETSSFTIQFWIKPSNLSTNNGDLQGLVTKKTASGIGYGIFWSVNGTGGRIRFFLKETSTSGNSTKSIFSDYISNLSTFGWNHISAVVKRNPSPALDTAYLYINGQLESKSEISAIGDMTSTQPLRFMNYAGNTASLCAGGSLDEIRIWNVALTEFQIQRLYAEPIEEIPSGPFQGKVRGKISGKVSPLLNWSSLVGYWDMEENPSSISLNEKSNNTNIGNFNDGSTLCTTSPCGPVFRVFGQPGYDPKEIFVSAATGLWSVGTTWDGGVVPNTERAVIYIKNGHVVTADNTFVCEDLNIEFGATLTANTASVVKVYKYLDVEGTLDCKTAGNFLFNQLGNHKIFGSGTFNFFNFELFQNSQLQIETTNLINIYGILVHGNGRIRTSDNIVLKVNKINVNRPYGLISKVSVGLPDIVGTIKMEKVLSNSNAGWRQMSLPFAGNLTAFNGLTLKYNTAPSNEQNVFFWNNQQNGSIPANSVGWTSASSTDNQSMAYSIYLDDADFSFTNPLVYEGEYNFGDKTYILTCYNDPGNPIASGNLGYENGVGWNFIPNLYPSLLDVQQMIADNPLSYKNIHIWDANMQQYKAFTANANDFIVPYNNTGTQSAELAGAAIEPMQGFWVKTEAAENGAVFTLKDDWRSTDFALNPHPSLKSFTGIQLDVRSTQSENWDATLISFSNTASANFVGNEDAYKLMSPANVPSLFTSADNTFLQINCLPLGTTQIPLFFKPIKGVANERYILELRRNHLPLGKAVVLKDLETGVLHELSSSEYTFEANSNHNMQRFLLFLVDERNVSALLEQSNQLLIYVEEEGIILSSLLLNEPAEVFILDISGRAVYKSTTKLGERTVLPLPDAPGIYFVGVNSYQIKEFQRVCIYGR